MRILHLPTAVGGNAYGLSRGERLHGVHSDVMSMYSPFSYPADIVISDSEPNGVYEKVTSRLKAIREFFRIRTRYDVFHFNFGSSLLHLPRLGILLADLPYYPKDAKIVFTYNGCDARQKIPDGGISTICEKLECGEGFCTDVWLNERKRKSIAKMDHYADVIYALNPDLLRFLPARAKFLPYTIAAWDEMTAPPYSLSKRPLRIIHAPTNRKTKGTEHICNAIDRLAEKHTERFSFTLIEGVTNSEARSLLANADLVIDQLNLGWYGGVAVEAMKLGKPVVVNITAESFSAIPERMASQLRETIINADANSIYNVLDAVIDDTRILTNFSKASLDYVNAWHDPWKIGQETIADYACEQSLASK